MLHSPDNNNHRRYAPDYSYGVYQRYREKERKRARKKAISDFIKALPWILIDFICLGLFVAGMCVVLYGIM